MEEGENYNSSAPTSKSKVVIKAVPINAEQLRGAYEIVAHKEENAEKVKFKVGNETKRGVVLDIVPAGQDSMHIDDMYEIKCDDGRHYSVKKSQVVGASKEFAELCPDADSEDKGPMQPVGQSLAPDFYSKSPEQRVRLGLRDVK